MSIVDKVNCQSCGAPLSLRSGEVIITCQYCGTPFNIASGKVFFLKHSIIPSSVDRGRCKELVLRWMSSGSLKPSNLAKASRITDSSQTFLPFYIVHTNVTTEYKGVFNRTGTESSRSGTLHREYHWKILGRRGTKFPTKEYEIPLKGKEDFDLSKVPDGSKFLNAEFDEKDAEDLARVEIADHQRFLLKESVDRFDELNNRFETESVEFVHSPVWRIDFTYNGSDYQILLCGSTGEVIRGDIPPPEESVRGFFSDLKRAFIGR